MWRRVLLGDGGVGSFVGLVLALGAGVGLLWIGVADVREAVRLQPVEQTCAQFLASPGAEARWVSVTGCRLDLQGAASRRWRGLFRQRDGGEPTRTLELFIPVSELGKPAPEVPSAVVATTDPELLGLIDELQKLPVEQVDAFVDAHTQVLEAKLAPAHLEGYVEPISSSGSRAALSVMTASDAVVLEQGRQPLRSNALCSVALGLAVLVWALFPVSRRWALEREERSGTPPAT